MERRDQQQQQRQQQQGMAPFWFVHNWQEPVDMYLLRSIGSSIVKRSEGSRLRYLAVFQRRSVFQSGGCACPQDCKIICNPFAPFPAPNRFL
jgi:hypothetical protein